MAIVQDSPINIKTAFDNILSVCMRARRKPFGREPALWKAFQELSKHLKGYASNRLTLKTKWSVGKGAWARVPWIALPDERETKSTRHGIYPVYLFREDLSGVYVALNQGIDLLKDEQGAPESRRILRERAEQLRRNLPALQTLKSAGFSVDDNIDLHTSGGLARNYKASIVGYKLYRRGEIPNDAELLNDLEQLLTAYDEYLKRGPFLTPQAPALKLVSDRSPQHVELSAAVHDVISYIADRGFIYEPWQIAQYIAAAQTKPFLILAGMSGTGKSTM
ncbi:MAG TPA: DUF3578 domain-containing protein, partial [Pyrinomonadaceae bacterium]|nr:DUF3578 domain-containing protein [Pyrinomonadaceae bacterium]